MIHLTENHLIVPLPEGAKDISLTVHKDGILFRLNEKTEQIDLPPKTQWSILCNLDEVTEEKAQEIYNDFPADKSTTQYSRLDLFKLKIEEQGWYLRNPYGEKKPMFKSGGQPEMMLHKINLKHWQESEAKTIKYGVLLGKQ